MKKLTLAVLMVLWLVGGVAALVTGLWILGAILFGLDTSVGYPGLIAWIPPWVVPFSFLLLLGKTTILKEAKERFLDGSDPRVRAGGERKWW